MNKINIQTILIILTVLDITISVKNGQQLTFDNATTQDFQNPENRKIIFQNLPDDHKERIREKARIQNAQMEIKEPLYLNKNQVIEFQEKRLREKNEMVADYKNRAAITMEEVERRRKENDNFWLNREQENLNKINEMNAKHISDTNDYYKNLKDINKKREEIERSIKEKHQKQREERNKKNQETMDLINKGIYSNQNNQGMTHVSNNFGSVNQTGRYTTNKYFII